MSTDVCDMLDGAYNSHDVFTSVSRHQLTQMEQCQASAPDPDGESTIGEILIGQTRGLTHLADLDMSTDVCQTFSDVRTN